MIARNTLFLLFTQLLWASSPNAPSDLVLVPSATSVTLHWQDNADNEMGFKIYRDGDYLATLPSNSVTYHDSGLHPNTTYRYTVKATNDRLFSDEALEAPLQIQYHDEKPLFVEKEDSVNYRIDAEGRMVFSIQDSDDLKRVELRTHKGNEWDLSTTPKSMIASVRINPSAQTQELTWMQLHHKTTGAKPFVRLVWKCAKDVGAANTLWAVVRKNEESDGKVSDWYYLRDFEAGHVYDSEIILLNNTQLYINIDGQELYLTIPEYWQNQKDFYFKAGLYFSGENTLFSGEVIFEKLVIE